MHSHEIGCEVQQFINHGSSSNFISHTLLQLFLSVKTFEIKLSSHPAMLLMAWLPKIQHLKTGRKGR
jgi:hypothetical protein